MRTLRRSRGPLRRSRDREQKQHRAHHDGRTQPPGRETGKKTPRLTGPGTRTSRSALPNCRAGLAGAILFGCRVRSLPGSSPWHRKNTGKLTKKKLTIQIETKSKLLLTFFRVPTRPGPRHLRIGVKSESGLVRATMMTAVIVAAVAWDEYASCTQAGPRATTAPRSSRLLII
jgi:hypothetical protein